ncbi:MAG TPA: NADH-quinone oxidoreductase subunit L [Terriglobales bacterium]|nr:NADH-quinone oxidoreductase subunit L [Terriglobales bacterium]
MFFLDHIWLIPLFPAFGAACMFFFGRRLSKSAVNGVCVGVIVLAFVWATLAAWQYNGYQAANPGKPFEKVMYTWLGTGTSSGAEAPEINSGADANLKVRSTSSSAGAEAPNTINDIGDATINGRSTTSSAGDASLKARSTAGSRSATLSYPTHDGSAPFRADAGFLLDPLSAIWLLFVTGVGMLIHIYSMGYMAHEGGYYRFFGYLNLFMFSMLTLILANNYALMFVGWEGVGLCSYLLIGFYFLRHSASTAANKAFITNRVGDAGFILGMLMIAWRFGTVQYTAVNHIARSGALSIGDPVITAACLFLFIGACGKSAQLPLYVWLPDTMEGPTPVSALIHAATMVTAGVYMVARSNALFVLAPTAMKTVAIVGALTAIFAATIGLVQNDIKRVLAYSTVSQLGYMFLALGVGAFAAGVFHVFTHAFFKALLFLGAGSVIHAMSGQQEMQFMGGLHKRIKTTFGTMLIGTLAIAGIPGFAGFFSKDAILWEAWSREGGAYRYLWAIAFLTALMTSFYMFRLIYLTFFGKPRMSHEVEQHIHESPRTMTGVLVVLAICSIGAGWLGLPHSLGGTNRFEKFLAPVFAKEAVVLEHEGDAAQVAPGEKEVEHTDPLEYVLMFASVGAAIVGWWLAQRAYKNADKGYKEPIQEIAPPVYKTLFRKWYVDEVYDRLVTGRAKVGGVRLGTMGLGEGLWKFDAEVVDGAVNGAGWTTRGAATLSTLWDKWIIDGLCVNGVAIVTRMLSYPVRLVQWGLVQWYALVMVGGLVGLSAYYIVPPPAWRWMGAHWFVTTLAAVGVIVVISFAGYVAAKRPPQIAETKSMAAAAGD